MKAKLTQTKEHSYYCINCNEPLWSSDRTCEDEGYLDRMRSAASAAYSFLNMVKCEDCGLPWPEGYIHFGCPNASKTSED